MKTVCCILTVALAIGSGQSTGAEERLRLASFRADVTPPLGSPLCNGSVKPADEIVSPLEARGIVLLGAGEPIVLCAFDWVGIGNESHDHFREVLASAVDTEVDRVAVHTLHQHDAPGSDLATERLLTAEGLAGTFSNDAFDREAIGRVAAAAKESLGQARSVTHLGLGAARVEKVASNRRILGADGKRVVMGRMSSCRKPEAIAAAEGVVDPMAQVVAFWDGEVPIAVMTYYATHPMSFYGKGGVNWDFPGYAREIREQALPGVPHLHFTGAGGNVAAGKYNDGSPEKRPVLAERLADGIARAWEAQEKRELGPEDVGWLVEPVSLPLRDRLLEDDLEASLGNDEAHPRTRIRAARDLVFKQRMQVGHRIPLTCLRLGEARIVHMPGELFIEYQMAAQSMRLGDFVAMAAYGDYGPGYIGTEVAYSQGGYEVGIVSRVDPSVEGVLMSALRKLLEVD